MSRHSQYSGITLLRVHLGKSHPCSWALTVDSTSGLGSPVSGRQGQKETEAEGVMLRGTPGQAMPDISAALWPPLCAFCIPHGDPGHQATWPTKEVWLQGEFSPGAPA